MPFEPRILVLVLAARAQPYPLLTRAIEWTWAAATVPGVTVLSYTGGRQLRRRGSRLQLPVPDEYEDIGAKTLAAFEHVLAHDEFDLLFRTNSSSYVDPSNLRAWAVEHGRRDRFYAGVVDVHEGIEFASGSGYFLSRDLVKRVVARRSEWDHAQPDDVALAVLVAGEGVAPERAPRVEYRDSREIDTVDTRQYHFRVKTRSGLRIDDVEAMLTVHRAFRRGRGQPFPLRLMLAWRAIRVARSLVRRLLLRGRSSPH